MEVRLHEIYHEILWQETRPESLNGMLGHLIGMRVIRWVELVPAHVGGFLQ